MDLERGKTHLGATKFSKQSPAREPPSLASMQASLQKSKSPGRTNMHGRKWPAVLSPARGTAGISGFAAPAGVHIGQAQLNQQQTDWERQQVDLELQKMDIHSSTMEKNLELQKVDVRMEKNHLERMFALNRLHREGHLSPSELAHATNSSFFASPPSVRAVSPVNSPRKFLESPIMSEEDRVSRPGARARSPKAASPPYGRYERLREELGRMGLRALQQRAAKAGASEQEIEEALACEEWKTALVDLVITYNEWQLGSGSSLGEAHSPIAHMDKLSSATRTEHGLSLNAAKSDRLAPQVRHGVYDEPDSRVLDRILTSLDDVQLTPRAIAPEMNAERVPLISTTRIPTGETIDAIEQYATQGQQRPQKLQQTTKLNVRETTTKVGDVTAVATAKQIEERRKELMDSSKLNELRKMAR